MTTCRVFLVGAVAAASDFTLYRPARVVTRDLQSVIAS